jgi:hypothetical protein
MNLADGTFCQASSKARSRHDLDDVQIPDDLLQSDAGRGAVLHLLQGRERRVQHRLLVLRDPG